VGAVRAGRLDPQGLGSVPEVKLMRGLGRVDETTLVQVEVAVKAWLGLI